MNESSVRALVLTSRHSHDERDDEKSKEDKEQDLRDRGGSAGYTAEPKNTGNQRNNQKHQSIVEHFRLHCIHASIQPPQLTGTLLVPTFYQQSTAVLRSRRVDLHPARK